MRTDRRPLVSEYRSDIPSNVLRKLNTAKLVAWDIETTGIDWRAERIATCQLFIPAANPIIVHISDELPTHLIALLESQHTRKVFHHAMFDLRFMVHSWHASPRNVACTKIAAKLLDRNNRANHSLKHLLKRYCGVTLDKSLSTSDWSAEPLSDAQIRYAVNDVAYLPQLLLGLEHELLQCGLIDLAHECFACVPTQVLLEIYGYHDIYKY